VLSQLLKAEMAEREVRSIAYHMKVARFPANTDLSGFDFMASEINEATLRQLHKCEFLDGAENVVLIGGPGTGKTHAATKVSEQSLLFWVLPRDPVDLRWPQPDCCLRACAAITQTHSLKLIDDPLGLLVLLVARSVVPTRWEVRCEVSLRGR
jgi:hypothetical protein